MNKLFAFLIIFCFGFSSCSVAQQKPQTVSSQAEKLQVIHENIYKYFFEPSTGLFLETNYRRANDKPHSFLWPLCALIQAANEMEQLEPSKDYMGPVIKAINQYYNPNPPAPGYQAYVTKEETDTRYYDDNQWIAIAYLDAYKRTKDKKYLDLSKEIYDFMMTGYDDKTGGGIYWREGDKTTKNTCSNGPGALVALQMYNATKEKKYLTTAIDLYDWTNKHLKAPEGVYYDAIKIPSLKIDSARYTYNTGTMLQSAVMLYNITKDKNYLTQAQEMAQAAEKHFYKNGKLPGNYWFNAVLLRGYVELYKVDKNKERLQFIIQDANRVWEQERDDKNLIGRKRVKSLIDQSAMLEIFARIEQLNNPNAF